MDIQLILARAKSYQNLINYLESRVIKDLQKYYPALMQSCEDSLSDALDTIYTSDDYDGRGFIFIVDEWDCIFREAKGNKEVQKEYLDFLKG
ncbi:MAG: AAA family ATPase, partial [Lachnospiraceae bacterium]|nr:AAA family ATPase [Lachnospiraceae bacterium]